MDTDLRDRTHERPLAERRLSERAVVEDALRQGEAVERMLAGRHVEQQTDREHLGRAGFVNFLQACGAIVVVGLGLLCTFVISLVSLTTVPGDQRAAVVTAAFTVLGTIVGAYFGVKVGSAGKDQAEKARDAEAARAQELAAHLDPVTAVTALDRAHSRIERP
jgi:hypothetical protein